MTQVLDRMTWPEVKSAIARNTVAVIPLGAIEQHGPHLPLDTDAFLSRELAAAGCANHDAVVVPVCPLGYRSRPLSGGGSGFPGTIGLSGATFMAVVQEVVEALLEDGFRRVLLYVWHMENQNFAYEAAYLAAAHRDDVQLVVVESPFDTLSDETMRELYGDQFPGWEAEHAGIMETSMMLHLRPETVHMDRAVDDRLAEPFTYDLVPISERMMTASGVMWDATKSDAAKGKRVFEDVASALGVILDREFPDARRS